jgi:hypothetical protein
MNCITIYIILLKTWAQFSYELLSKSSVISHSQTVKVYNMA